MERRRCTVCGRVPAGYMELSLRGEVTCADHDVVARCLWCARPMCTATPAGWARIGDTQVRCPACIADGVDSQQDARKLIPLIRAEMAAIGINLATRVRIDLVNPSTLNADWHSGGRITVLGMTTHTVSSLGGEVEVLPIQVISGLTRQHFGMTVAHELGHAWLAQRGATIQDPRVEEGVCELFAGAWLKRQASPFARSIREAMLQSSDPLYGVGYQMVRAAVLSHGVDAVLDCVCKHGTLPNR